SLAEHRSTENFGMMSIDLLEILVKKTFQTAEHFCSFAFQGGEPTLAGLEFYRQLMRLEQKYNSKNIQVFNSIQTNGLTIDEAWAEFLRENDFLVGLSLDGPARIHDRYRKDPAGKGSFNQVMQTVEIFRRYRVNFNILIVVNNEVARHAKEIYQFFQEQNFGYLQFIPCLDPFDEVHGKHDYSLKPSRYGYFLMDLFDLWYRDLKKGKIVSVRFFDNWLQMLLGYPPESCGMAGQCAGYFVIEANGNVYPCDFYVTDQWLIGNIGEHDFNYLKNTSQARQFLEISRQIEPKCRSCNWYSLCRGGCRRNREPLINGSLALNYYCEAYTDFFEYTWEKFHELAKLMAVKYRLPKRC
ncbi:MAG: anaerobic sulfatase maturase, partial [Bacteroidota bacterium]